MPLTTKNNSLLVKNGKLVTDCACCGDDWYCCAITTASAASVCLSDFIKSVKVTIQSQDWFYRSYIGPTTYYAAGVRGSIIAGTYTVPHDAGNLWSLLFPNSEIYALQLSVAPTTPCCDSFQWNLIFAWTTYYSAFSGVSTPEGLWTTRSGVQYKLDAVTGTSLTCMPPVSSAGVNSFVLFDEPTNPGTTFEKIGTPAVTISVQIS